MKYMLMTIEKTGDHGVYIDPRVFDTADAAINAFFDDQRAEIDLDEYSDEEIADLVAEIDAMRFEREPDNELEQWRCDAKDCTFIVSGIPA